MGAGEPLLYIGSRVVTRATGEVDDGQALTSRELAVLGLLADAEGQPLSRERLLEAAFGATSGSSRAVDMTMRRLRAKLEEDPSNPKFLQTVYGKGYRLYDPRETAPDTHESMPEDPFTAALLTPGARVWLMASVGSGSSALLELHARQMEHTRVVDRPTVPVDTLAAPIIVVSGAEPPGGWTVLHMPSLSEAEVVERFSERFREQSGFERLVGLIDGHRGLLNAVLAWVRVASCTEIVRRFFEARLYRRGHVPGADAVVDGWSALPGSVRQAAGRLSMFASELPVGELDAMAVEWMMHRGWVVLDGLAVKMHPLARSLVVASMTHAELEEHRSFLGDYFEALELPERTTPELLEDALVAWDVAGPSDAISGHLLSLTWHHGQLQRVIKGVLDSAVSSRERCRWLGRMCGTDPSLGQRALALAVEVGDEVAAIRAWAAIGLTALQSADRDAADEAIEKMLERAGTPLQKAVAHSEVSRLLTWRGDHREALVQQLEALRFAGFAGESGLHVRVLESVGMCHSNLGHTDQAIAFLEQAAELATEIGYTARGPSIRSVLGAALVGRDLEQAEMALREAARSAQQQGQVNTEEHAQLFLGWVLLSRGRILEGQSLFRRLLRRSQRSGRAKREADAWAGVGFAQWRRGEVAQADASWEASLAIHRGRDALGTGRIELFRWLVKRLDDPTLPMPSFTGLGDPFREMVRELLDGGNPSKHSSPLGYHMVKAFIAPRD